VSEQKALNVGPSRIEVAYERFGDPQAPPVLLVQMLGWHEEFCAELVAHGVQVIRFDNRDVGLSSHFPDAPEPDLRAALAGDLSSAMCDVSGGRATAAAIPGAELVIFDGMGHHLPRAAWPEITSLIAGLVRRAEAATPPAWRRSW
jgi:pimeloyl-ACP methyl ester carboxylesterase